MTAARKGGPASAARVLFVPAIAVMNRLSYARKFILIALLMTGPLATVAYLQSSSANERLVITQKERAGVALLGPATDLAVAVERHRVLTARLAVGALDLAAEQDRRDAAERAGRALDRIAALDRGAQAWDEVRRGWEAARAAPPQGAEAAHATLASALLEALLARVGNESKLILDPGPDSYWLADALVVKIPELADTVARSTAAALSRAAPAAAAGQELARARATHLSQVILRTAFDEATHDSRGADLEAVVGGPLAEALAAVEQHAASLDVRPEEPGEAAALDRERLARHGLAALDRLHDLPARIAPQLDQLLARRVRRLESQRALGLAASGGAALVLAYLFVAIYLSVRESVRSLEEAAVADPATPEQFVAPSRDELGLMAEAYNRARGEQVALREQLRRADKLATIGQLAAGTAHELNEPIAAILGFAQLAQKCPELPAQADKDLGKIAKAALHAREIIKALLLFARQTPPQTALLDLNQVVAESLEFLQPRCERAGINVAVSLASDLPRVEADAGQLRQVVLNLVVNAIQATARDGSVAVATESLGGEVVLAVQDRGRGMTEEVRKHLFLPFYTTKDVGQGTGLGMSVVHGIVTAHGGTIHVDSAPERGTRIEVRLPAPARA